MRIRLVTAGLVGLATCAAAFAQGSFNFDDIPGIEEEPIVRVDFNSAMINLFRQFLDGANPDPAAPTPFAGLRGIKLRVYDASQSGRELGEYIQDTAQMLEGQGWQSVMSVQDEGSNVRFMLQMTDEAVTGMTAMVMDGTEAIFINIDGPINAAELGLIMAQAGVGDRLDSIPAFPPATSPPAPANDGN